METLLHSAGRALRGDGAKSLPDQPRAQTSAAQVIGVLQELTELQSLVGMSDSCCRPSTYEIRGNHASVILTYNPLLADWQTTFLSGSSSDPMLACGFRERLKYSATGK